MKSKISFTVLIGLMFVFSGCDYIDHPYTVPGPNGCTVAIPTFVPRSSPVKKVLVEDVTGHRCGNCPRAAETIETIKGTYGEQVVAIGLHSALSGTFTDPESTDTLINPSLKYIYDFRTTVAQEIDATFGVSTIGLPNGMVNRKDFGGGEVVGYTTWSSHVSSLLATPQEMDIQIKSFYDTTTFSLCSFYFVEALTDLTGDYKICMFLTEDSIVKWQKDYMGSPSTDISNYIHRHVLRASLNGTWGTPVNTGSAVASGAEYIDGFSITINPANWDVDHLYVVAFVYNAATYEVIQAEEMKVIP